MNNRASWVRSSLIQLNLLRGARPVDVYAGSVIEFAICWAPFGGAGQGDLLVSFGVGRQRFVEMLDEVLRPYRADDLKARWLKRVLRDSLMSQWRVENVPSARPGRC